MRCVTPFLLLSRQHGMVKRWWMRSAAAAGPHHTETTIGYSNKEVDATASDMEDLSSEKLADFLQGWRNIWNESYAIEFGSWHWPDAFGPRQLIRRLTVHSKLIFAWQAHPASSFLVAMKTIKGTNLWQIHRGLQSCWIQYWRLCLPTGLPNESNSVLERQSKSNFKNPNLWLQLRHFSMNLSRILMFLLLGIVYSERGSPSLLGNTAVTRWKQTPRQFKVWQAHSGEGMFLSFVPWQLFCGFFSSM